MADNPPLGYLLWETYGLRDNTYTGDRSLVKFYTLTEPEAEPPDVDRILQDLADPRDVPAIPAALGGNLPPQDNWPAVPIVLRLDTISEVATVHDALGRICAGW